MKVALYARVSTRGKQETENQLKQLKEFCKKSKWKIHKEYIDQESGTTGKRKEFQQLFRDASQKKFQKIIFWALDRFNSF